MDAAHVTAGAHGRSLLVADDEDRADLLRLLREVLRETLLAYCMMDTHLHLVVEGAASEAAIRVQAPLLRYARAFNRRHGFSGALLRGPAEAHRVWDEEGLARAIRYVHENPVRTRPPLAARPIDYPWSSARDLVGLRCSAIGGAARARSLLGRLAARVVGCAPALCDLEPVRAPTALPHLVLAAAAQAYGVAPSAVAGAGRAPELAAARRVYVQVGMLESYTQEQLAPALRRARTRVSRIAAEPVDYRDVRIARTLLREPGLRRSLLPRRAPEVRVPAG